MQSSEPSRPAELDAADPLVSIVTPCLNPGERLAECIQSVKSQTYSNVEHIVVDGGSTDGTIELLQRAEGVKWISEPDAGQTQALNKGFRMAAGEVLSWLNADDQLTPPAVKRAVGALLHKKAGWVYGNLRIEDGTSSRIWEPPSEPFKHLFVLGKGGVVPQPGTIFTKEALFRVGGLDESFELAMDFDLWLRFIDEGIPSTYVGETLAVFFIHPGSKTGRFGFDRFCLEEARAFEKLGRADLACLALGRAQAHRGLGPKGLSRDVEAEIERICGNTDAISRRKALQRVKAAARTEAALLDSKRVQAVRLMLSADPWLVRETRRRLAAAVWAAIQPPWRYLRQSARRT